jgi:hypothetical protein
VSQTRINRVLQAAIGKPADAPVQVPRNVSAKEEHQITPPTQTSVTFGGGATAIAAA